VNVLCLNTRSIVTIQTENNGRVLFVPIGAEAVGSVKLIVQEGDTVKKGDQLGFFQYGGSDILAIFENKMEWDEDIRKHSLRSIETLLHVNERIGAYIKN